VDRAGFEPATSAVRGLIGTSSGFPYPPAAEVNWDSFKEWLYREFSVRTAQDRFRYAVKYHECLLKADLHPLMGLSEHKRAHVLKALSALSKWMGIYGFFKGLVKDYGLKWSPGGRDDLMIARLVKGEPEGILEWMRRVKAEAPGYACFIDFMATTGLRYEEAINSWNLIIRLKAEGRLEEYYVVERNVLEHFRYRSLFLRRSKKVFISFVKENLIEEIAEAPPLTPYILINRVKRRGLRQRFGDIREYHATVLTRHLTQPEIDFLQGRVSTSVFMRHYFNPAWISDLQERTLKATEEILRRLKGE